MTHVLNILTILLLSLVLSERYQKLVRNVRLLVPYFWLMLLKLNRWKQDSCSYNVTQTFHDYLKSIITFRFFLLWEPESVVKVKSFIDNTTEQHRNIATTFTLPVLFNPANAFRNNMNFCLNFFQRSDIFSSKTRLLGGLKHSCKVFIYTTFIQSCYQLQVHLVTSDQTQYI